MVSFSRLLFFDAFVVHTRNAKSFDWKAFALQTSSNNLNKMNTESKTLVRILCNNNGNNGDNHYNDNDLYT